MSPLNICFLNLDILIAWTIPAFVADGGVHYCLTTGEVFPFLNCFSEDGEVLYKREGSPYPSLDGKTAVQDRETLSLNLYPNPFNNSATLKLPNTKLSGDLFTFNLIGELVDHRVIVEQYTTIHRGALPGGMYVYQFVGREGQVWVEKVIVE